MKPASRKLLSNLPLVAAFSSSVLIGAAIPSPAAAEGKHDARLRGSYAYTTAKTCVQSLDEILPPFYVFQSILSRQSSSDSGILTFNGDGTASAVGTVRTIDNTAPGGPLVAVNAFTSDISYSVNADGTVDMATILASFQVIFPPFNVVGTSTGDTSRLQIADGNSMLVSAPSEDYSVERLDFSTGQTTPRYRICTRNTTAVKIPGKNGKPNDDH